jgi:hypothetical protein
MLIEPFPPGDMLYTFLLFKRVSLTKIDSNSNACFFPSSVSGKHLITVLLKF